MALNILKQETVVQLPGFPVWFVYKSFTPNSNFWCFSRFEILETATIWP